MKVKDGKKSERKVNGVKRHDAKVGKRVNIVRSQEEVDSISPGSEVRMGARTPITTRRASNVREVGLVTADQVHTRMIGV